MIKAPHWCKDAVPTVQGWNDPKTGELLKSQKISVQEVTEWHAPKHQINAPKPKMLTEIVEHEELDDLQESDLDLDEE